MSSDRFQPNFIRRDLTISEKIWRAFLIVGLITSTAGVVAAAILTDWTDTWHRLVFSAVYFLAINYERTLDRWEPFVPPAVKGRH